MHAGGMVLFDVPPRVRRLRIAAAGRDIGVRQYLLEAIEVREDLRDDEELALIAWTHPVLAELWDKSRDAQYEQL